MAGPKNGGEERRADGDSFDVEINKAEFEQKI